MSAAIAYLFVVGVLLAVAARTCEEGLRLAKRPTRHAWAGALVLLIVLSVRGIIAGPDDVTAPLQAPTAAGASADQPVAGFSRWASVLAFAGRTRSLIADAPAIVTERIGMIVPDTLASTLAAVWGTMSVTVLLLLVFTYWRFSRAVRALPAATLHGVRVRVSPAAGPAVVGVRDPQVVVPAWLLDAPEGEQRLAIAHEREHLAAHDPKLLIAACIAAAAMPWHPAVWWMLSRLRLAVEMDCDARVLAAGTPLRLYGTTLIDIAARGGRLPLGAPALADHTTHLERRLIAMTTSPAPFGRTRLLAVGAAAMGLVLAACEARVPSSPEIEGMDALAIAQNPLTRAALAGDSVQVWYVDGVRMSAAGIETIAAEDIASMEVIRGTSGNEVRIATRTRGTTATPDVAISISPLPQVPAGTSPSAGAPKTRTLRPLSGDDYAGLILIDGNPADKAALRKVATEQVVSIEVLKGAAAKERYADPRAANGVILVTLKQ